MSSGSGRRAGPPAGEGLRNALRWLSEQGRHDFAAIEEACRRHDLSPLDEEFLLAEARRMGTDAVARDGERAHRAKGE